MHGGHRGRLARAMLKSPGQGFAEVAFIFRPVTRTQRSLELRPQVEETRLGDASGNPLRERGRNPQREQE